MQETPQTRAEQALTRVADGASRPDFPSNGAGTPAISPFAALKRHPLVAILILLLVSGLGAPLIIRKVKPLYFANSVIYVSPTFDDTLKDDPQQRPQFNIQQQMLLISRYDVATKTVQKLLDMGIDLRLKGESVERAAERLIKAIEINHIQDSYEVSIGLHSKDPRTLADLLNCLADTYIATSRSEEFYGLDHRIQTLNSERDRLQFELDGAVQSRSLIERNLGVADFEVLPTDKLLETTAAALEQARRARVESEAEVSLLERDASLANSSLPAQPIPPGDTARIGRLEDRRGEIEKQLSGLKPGNPDYGSLTQELVRINSQLKEAEKLSPAQARPVESSWSQLLAKARIELERERKAEAELSSELVTATAKADGSAVEFQRGRDLAKQIEQLRAQISAIDDRLAYFRVEASAPPSVRIVSPARTPLTPEKDRRKVYLAGLMGLALCMSMGGVLLIDAAGSRVLNARDVESVLGFPPLGVMLSREAGTQDFAQEQFARMINNIERTFKRSGARVFVFTPINPGTSNTRLVDSIAGELQMRRIGAIALGTGAVRPVAVGETRLVMAARNGIFRSEAISDPGRPRIPGAMYLGDEDQLDDTNPHYANGLAGRIKEMMADNELVLVDAPPLLLSAEAEYLATLATVTFLTIEAGKVSRRNLKRAAALMERLRPAGIAAIVHSVSLKSGDSQLRRSFTEFEACRSRGTRTQEGRT